MFLKKIFSLTSDSDDYVLLNENRIKKRRGFRKYKKVIYGACAIIIVTFIFLFVNIISTMSFDKKDNDDFYVHEGESKYINENENLDFNEIENTNDNDYIIENDNIGNKNINDTEKENNYINEKGNMNTNGNDNESILLDDDEKEKGFIHSDNILLEYGLEGFELVDRNNTSGPITVDKASDDGGKYVLKDLMLENNEENFESFYYDYNKFNQLNQVIPKGEEYFCTVGSPTETFKGYDLSCPEQYTIEIDYAFYGRYPKDEKHCTRGISGKKLPKKSINNKEICGRKVPSKVREICNGVNRCTLRPSHIYFSPVCPELYKYLHVKYHCEKNKELKKPKMAVVLFANKVSPNSVYEHSISEFYQYCKIHGYKFIFNNKRYNTNRNIFYMKLNVLSEAITQGLKTGEFDWILWTDSDVTVANPNIKLESFLPPDSRVHFIAAADRHGLNAGVFMIRVSPWSLDYITRALALAYFKKKTLRFSDQSALNNVLVMDKEDKHYMVVPQHWFNNYPNKLKPGDFLFHMAGSKSKSKSLKELHEKVNAIEGYMTSQTNESLRKEVLEYYEKQKKKKTLLQYQ